MAQPVWQKIVHGVLMWSLAFLGVLAIGETTSAHTITMVKSEPANGVRLVSSPRQVLAHFNEELDSHASTINVMDARGRVVSEERGGVDLKDPDRKRLIVALPTLLPAGLYLVRWHVVLQDGDTSDGTFQFTVTDSGDTGDAQPVTNGSTPPLPIQVNNETVTKAISTLLVPSTNDMGQLGASGHRSPTALTLMIFVLVLFCGWYFNR